MTGPLGHTAGKNGSPELPAVKDMTVADLEARLIRRGVLGCHVSLVGLHVTVTAVTEYSDAVVSAPNLEAAFSRLLSQLPVVNRA